MPVEMMGKKVYGNEVMKRFFSYTKFLWIGGVMGILQQLLGYLDYVLYHGRDIFSFSGIMDCLSLYAAIILLVILRDVSPKQQFRDLILFFVGLDFFYYLYIFVIDLVPFLADAFAFTDTMDGPVRYFEKTAKEIYDFIFWTTIGFAAAAWAFSATKLRNHGKKVLYKITLLPLFAVMVILLISGTYNTIMFFATGGKWIPLPGSDNGYYSYVCEISGAMTSLTALVVCLYQFLKKAAAQKNSTQS